MIDEETKRRLREHNDSLGKKTGTGYKGRKIFELPDIPGPKGSEDSKNPRIKKKE